ncbi:MAG: septum site-determining protein MinC, partial [Aquificaceae bacterium]
MIEIKGITLPVLLVEIKERGDINSIVEEIRSKTSSKLFEGSYILIDSKGLLEKEEVERIESALASTNIKSVKRLSNIEATRGERLL